MSFLFLDMNDITQHLCLSSVAKVVVNCFEKVPLLRDEMIELPRLVWTGVEIMQSWPIPRIRVDFNVSLGVYRSCIVLRCRPAFAALPRRLLGICQI